MGKQLKKMQYHELTERGRRQESGQMKCGDKTADGEKKSKNKQRYELKAVTLDGARVRMSDQGCVMGGSHEEIDGGGR